MRSGLRFSDGTDDMDRSQHKKLSHGREKIDRSRGEGNAKCKRRTVSSFGSPISPNKKWLAFESKQISSAHVNKAPMKLLLAEEMSKEVEPRRHSPSIIAKLMGLDGLPTQQPVHKQKQVTNSYFQPKDFEKYEVNCPSYGERSFQMNRKDQLPFKDVFEVMESSKSNEKDNRLFQKGMWSSKPTEMKMDYIWKKFMDAKRLSTDENLQRSKEFHETLEALNSNKDLLLKFLQEHDSLFNKHLHDLQAVQNSSLPSHIRVLKSSRISSNGRSEKLCISQGKMNGNLHAHKSYRNFSQNHEKCCVSHKGRVVCLGGRGEHPDGEGNSETCLWPTRIVVLKPNLWKEQRMENSSFSPTSCASSHSRHRSVSCGNEKSIPEVRDRIETFNDAEVDRTKRSREIAREITRKMRHNAIASTNASTSILKGYAGDKSSCSILGTDSANNSETSSPISRNLHGWNSTVTSLSSTESFVSREAKKRLSERLKTIHTVQEGRLVNEGSSTLREMLALPDKEAEVMTSDSNRQLCSGNWSTRKGAVEKWRYPLSASNKDGWKDAPSGNLTRSRSLPSSSASGRRLKTSCRDRMDSDDDSLMLRGNPHKDRICREEIFIKKEKLSPTKTNLSLKRSESSLYEGLKNNANIREIHVIPEELMEFKDGDKCDRTRSESKSSASGNGDTMQLHDGDDIAVSEGVDLMISYNVQEEHLLKPVDSIALVEDLDVSAENYQVIEGIPVNSSPVVSQGHVIEPDSPQSSKEAEQPSPVSVLEPSFREIATSDCFERVNADLQGLRAQLQLLKLESAETFLEEPEFAITSFEEPEYTITSDSDAGEGCCGLSEGKGDLPKVSEENKDYHYLVDVLVDSGLQATDRMRGPDGRFYFSESSVDLGVFENLEKKYCSLTSWPRSERRLLFDRINSALIEICQPHRNIHSWVQLKANKAGFTRDCESLLEETWQYLTMFDQGGNRTMPEKLLGWEVNCLEMGDEVVDGIGEEVQQLIINELIEECVKDLSFNGGV